MDDRRFFQVVSGGGLTYADGIAESFLGTVAKPVRWAFSSERKSFMVSHSAFCRILGIVRTSCHTSRSRKVSLPFGVTIV